MMVAEVRQQPMESLRMSCHDPAVEMRKPEAPAQALPNRVFVPTGHYPTPFSHQPVTDPVSKARTLAQRTLDHKTLSNIEKALHTQPAGLQPIHPLAQQRRGLDEKATNAKQV